MADFTDCKKHKISSQMLSAFGRSNSTGMMSPASSVGSSPGTVFSPMTNLAMTLGQLNTSSDLIDTPKRKLSMSLGSPTPSSSCRPRLSWSDGKKMPSLDEVDGSPFILKFPRSTEKNRPKPTTLLRKIQSMPQNGFYSPLSLFEDAQRMGTVPLSPKFPSPHAKYTSGSFVFHDESSHDSGLGDSHSCKDEDFHFTAPVGMPPRSNKKHFNDDTCSPFSYSPLNKEKRGNQLPPTCLFSPDEKPLCASPQIMKKKRIPLKTLMSSDSNISVDEDDGFLEMMDDIDEMDDVNKVSGLKDLIKAPILSSTCSFAEAKKSHDNRENISPPWKKRVLPRGLFRSPSAPRLNLEQAYERGRPSFKRPDPPRDDLTPVLSKRRKSVPNLTDEAESNISPRSLAAKVERCNTDNELVIKSALSRGAIDSNLIGDCSRAYCLPHVRGNHSDLKYITPDTLADLVDGKYGDIVEQFHIADCRYPYEFNGGHIKGAKNLYSREDIKREYLENRKTVTDKNKRLVIIFHCEFSSERGPKLSRYLRGEDRTVNAADYPALYYPEIYLLEGGYKAFYNQTHLRDLCEPQAYTPMLHEDYTQDLKHFRAKSKSWNGEKSNRFKTGRKY
ncbi:M-phase inducer phosphatase 1-like [Tubulanus polymorphus]|uniref:M-phase inducer phosphatase 1-like n=1 Tax=Tubulanus polymorphus TaxID=672921 RepID=UPI003DA33D90